MPIKTDVAQITDRYLAKTFQICRLQHTLIRLSLIYAGKLLAVYTKASSWDSLSRLLDGDDIVFSGSESCWQVPALICIIYYMLAISATMFSMK